MVVKTKGNEGTNSSHGLAQSRHRIPDPKFDGANPHADTHGGRAEKMKESGRWLIVIMSPRHSTDGTECALRVLGGLLDSQAAVTG